MGKPTEAEIAAERKHRIDQYAGQYAGIRVVELAAKLVDLEMK